MYLLGYDVGSSSINASINEAQSRTLVWPAVFPQKEMVIHAPNPVWAEQAPVLWWKHVVTATRSLISETVIGFIREHGLEDDFKAKHN